MSIVGCPPTSWVVSPPVHCATKFSASFCDRLFDAVAKFAVGGGTNVGSGDTLGFALLSDGMLTGSQPRDEADRDAKFVGGSIPFCLAVSAGITSADLGTDSVDNVRGLSVSSVLATLLVNGSLVSVSKETGLSVFELRDDEGF